MTNETLIGEMIRSKANFMTDNFEDYPILNKIDVIEDPSFMRVKWKTFLIC